MELIDTHTHLYLPEFDADRDEMIGRALGKGVSKMFLPNIDSRTIIPMLKLADTFPDNCFPMMGLHPCSVDAAYEKEMEIIKNEFGKRKYYGVGEIGIDLYHDITFAGQQKDAFRIQLQCAKEMKLPAIIHCRNAFRETIEIVSDELNKGLKGIFHCFSGTNEDAKKIMELRTFKLGIGGVITYKKSGLNESLKDIPLTALVLETDSPYLTPVPFRGKRNESSFLTFIVDKLSEIYNVSSEKIAELTTINAKEIFSLNG